MFEIASMITPGGPEELYLRRCGWDVPDQSRLFAQANHADHLSELMSTVLAPIDAEHSLGIGKAQTCDTVHGIPEPNKSTPDYAPALAGAYATTNATQGSAATTSLKESVSAEPWSAASGADTDFCPRQCCANAHECYLNLPCVQMWMRDTGYRIAFRILRHQQDVEDALQDASLEICRRCRAGRIPSCVDCKAHEHLCCLGRCPTGVPCDCDSHWCSCCQTYCSAHPCCRRPSWLASLVHVSAREIARKEAKHKIGRRDVLELDERVYCDLYCRRYPCCLIARFDVHVAVGQLDEPDRTLVRLRYFHDCLPREIAKAMGMDPSEVDRVLARARRSLRQFLRYDGCCCRNCALCCLP